MKKREFLLSMVNNVGYETSMAECERMINALVLTIQDELKSDEMKSIVPGMGRFKLVTRAARTGRNPATGEAMEIPEKMVIKFKAAKGFYTKTQINVKK